MEKNKKTIVIIIFLYLVLFCAFLFNKKEEESLSLVSNFSSSPESVSNNIEENVVIPEDIFVHISGEINYPGLLKLKKGQRLYEAIEMAGGVTKDADLDSINLAMVLADEDKIYIPKIGESAPEFLLNIDSGNSKINLNRATKEDLMSLDGIGDKTAEAIIKYRDENGFNEIEDIMKVPGIGKGKFYKIKDDITL